MARSRSASASARSRRAAPAPEPVGTELLGLTLGLGSALLFGALVTLAPEGVQGGLRNVVGSLGQGIAASLTRALGLGAWVLPIFGLAWAWQALRGQLPAHLSRKALLLPVALVLVATLAALILPPLDWPGIVRSGPGGYMGLAFGASLQGVLGPGAILVVLVALFATLRFVADLDVVRAGRWVARRTGLLEDPEAKAKTRRKAPGRRKPVTVEEDEDLEDDEWDEEEDPELEDDETIEGEDEDEWEWVEEDDAEAEYVDGEDLADEDEEEDEAAEDATPAVRPPAPIHITTRKPKKPRGKRIKERGAYKVPPLDLLDMGRLADPDAVKEEVAGNVRVLEETLSSFGVEARVVSTQRGPAITFCEIKVPSGIRLNRVTKLADDLAIALKAPSVRIVAPIPGRSTVGIEIPNLERDVVVLRDLLEEGDRHLERKAVPILLGRDTAGRAIIEDLATMPHALIAGATGSGKSVCINAILLSILFTRAPDEVNLILIDPKQVELSFYEGIPHLLTPVVTDMKKASKILDWAVDRMEERYAQLLAAGVRNIKGYNELSVEKKAKVREKAGLDEEALPDRMTYLVIVVDELADLILTIGKDVEKAITRLAQKSRAVGIHVILATQRPSTNVITGLIKANMPTRMSFVVSSKIDSRVVLDANGAEKLLGMGDMLYMHPRSLTLRRAQGTLVTDGEARGTVDFLKEQYPEPEYEDLLAPKAKGLGDPLDEDDLYDDAARVVLAEKLGSASKLQRRLGIGYTRASRLIEMMEDRGVVGPHVGSKAREVLLDLPTWEAMRAQEKGITGGPIEAYDHEDPPCVDESWD